MMNIRRFHRRSIWLWLFLLLSLDVLYIAPPATADTLTPFSPEQANIAIAAFNKLWSRNDLPVLAQQVERSWLWGPTNVKIGLEAYADSAGGVRAVAYYDKSRMEINDLKGDPNSKWYVTNGLLVREMVAGKIQTGNSTSQNLAAARVPVAGDATANPNAPTYASFSKVASLNSDNRVQAATGANVLATIDSTGRTNINLALNNLGVRYAYYEPTLGHNIPDVFMNFFNSQGIVNEKGVSQTGQLFDDWIFACGLPITEPYWTTVKVAGRDTTVLVQLFERRVLTYNPTNALSWRVEMGNVGQHYYNWRYTQNTAPATPTPQPQPSPVVTPTPVPVGIPAAVGTLETLEDGQHRLTIGNNVVKRVVVFGKEHGAFTNSFINQLTLTNYLQATNHEFRIILSNEISGGTDLVEISSDSLTATGFNWVSQTSQQQEINVTFSGSFQEHPLRVNLHYQALAAQNFIRKWLTIEPFNANGWAIENVVVEDWQPVSEIEPIIPTPRYGVTFPNNKPDYNKYNDVITSDPQIRFTVGDHSSSVGQYANKTEGLYFFHESLFGEEILQPGSLKLSNIDFVEPKDGFSSGRSVIGMWQGTTEIGFKRFNEYVYNFYAASKGKKDPVWFSTWYPYESGINATVLNETIDEIKTVGFYDMLHIDAGWQANQPLEVNRDRFPNGLEPIIAKLRSNNLLLGLWMNPFSGSYESLEGYAAFRKQYPQWIDANDERRICPLSGAGKVIHDRLVEIATNWPLDEIYWDGADWNIGDCQSPERGWRTATEERVKTLKFYNTIMADIHRLRPQLRVVVWSAPPDIHWLSAVDQVQFSDVDDAPIIKSELVRRQQLYYSSFGTPYGSIWGDWYGLGYRRQWADGLGQPLNVIKYALVSTIANGGTQAGGSVYLKITPPNVLDFMKKLFAWRKRFENYFSVYQHVLNFPDGQSVDGEAHIINGQGFIMLYNPTDSEKTVEVPLSEPELELSSARSYGLSDWTELTSGKSLGSFRPTDKVAVTIPALGYRIIGVNL